MEVNPGPRSRTNSQSAAQLPSTDIVAMLANLTAGQNALMEKLQKIEANVSQTDRNISNLCARMTQLENDCAPLAGLREDVSALHSTTCDTRKRLSDLVARVDDAENRSRRCNLLFFGVTDDQSENWSQSAAKITDLCSQKMSITITPSEIERAHRIGKFSPGRNRPIVVQFSSFRTKDGILSKGHQFKNTRYSVSEDFSPTVRQARRHLLTFARAQSSPFTLRYNKLKIGSNVFFFDHDTESVKQCSP